MKTQLCIVLALLASLHVGVAGRAPAADLPLRVGSFAVDASPPLGSPLAYNPCDRVAMPLTARGIVLLGSGEPIVLCAVDWIGIANDGYEQWREAIARAVGTRKERVAVHTLHQHDAPVCDFSAERILAEHGLGGKLFDVPFARHTIDRVAEAAREALDQAREVTHLGLGEAKVEKVASNRRILGPDGKVRGVRYTSCRDPDLRAAPEGIIDPMVKTISFWNKDRPLVVLTYYATHPQSYYLTGVANPDFPGMARFLREVTLNGLTHVHFDGAGGNIGAGKYNDGNPENRQKLAVRLADGMARAWQATEKRQIAAKDVGWKTVPVALPVSHHLQEAPLLAALDDPKTPLRERKRAARELVWLRRCAAGDTIDVTCLALGRARILSLPGEAVVEYQLAAQKMRPDCFVAVAAYGEYGPGYICLEEHYQQGGYEDSPHASLVAPSVERVLKAAIETVLRD